MGVARPPVCHSRERGVDIRLQVAVDVQSRVKDAKHLDHEGVTNEIGDATVSIEQNANRPLRLGTMSVSEQGKGWIMGVGRLIMAVMSITKGAT